MDNNRRGFLKLFAAGAVIAPVAASEVHARLVEPAKVELFESVPALPPKHLSCNCSDWSSEWKDQLLFESFIARQPLDCTLLLRDFPEHRFHWAAYVREIVPRFGGRANIEHDVLLRLRALESQGLMAGELADMVSTDPP